MALAELTGELREGLLALAVGTGLQVMAALMEEDVTARCGRRGRHDPERTATRHGHERGSVSLGGRRVPVQRPRMRAVDGSGELAVPSYELFSLDRGPGSDGAGADAGRAVDPALPGRARAGWHADRAVGEVDIEVRGVAAVRRGDRDRAGRAARRGSVRAGSGGADGRRGALRRALLRGRARDRHRRDQAPVVAGGGLDGEHHAGHRPDRRAARAGPGRDPPDPGRCSTGRRRCAARCSTCSTGR